MYFGSFSLSKNFLACFVKPAYCSLRMCSQATLTHRLWEIENLSTQSWELSKIGAFLPDFSYFPEKTSKNAPILKLQILRIGLMDFWFLKACGSSRLWSTFWSHVGFTIHANKIFVSQKVPKYTCLPSFIVYRLGQPNVQFSLVCETVGTKEI